MKYCPHGHLGDCRQCAKDLSERALAAALALERLPPMIRAQFAMPPETSFDIVRRVRHAVGGLALIWKSASEIRRNAERTVAKSIVKLSDAQLRNLWTAFEDEAYSDPFRDYIARLGGDDFERLWERLRTESVLR